MATAYERWSDRQLTKAVNGGWKAVRAWDVDDATSETDAMGASGIPAINAAHPLNAALKCRSIDADRNAFNSYLVRATYEIPPDNNSYDDPADDPLNAPPRISWDLGNTTEPVDQDEAGNPITNSARTAFADPLQRNFTTLFVSVKRHEPFFDVALAYQLSNKVNDSDLLLVGAGWLQAGQLRCEVIKPTGEFASDATAIEIEYRFEVREDGFKARVMDQGFQANTASGPMRIFDAEGNPIDEPALLKGDGTTVESAFLVGDPDNPTIQAATSAPPGAEVEINETTGARFLKYALYSSADFSNVLQGLIVAG